MVSSHDPSTANTRISTTIFRVYPFVVHLPEDWNLELRGTEHDEVKFVTIEELQVLQPTVPMLVQAFHHATYGKYLTSIPETVRIWANNHHDGAMTMAKQAIRLVKEHPDVDPTQLRFLRPTMVAITNVLDLYIEKRDANQVLGTIEQETERAIDVAVKSVVEIVQQ